MSIMEEKKNVKKELCAITKEFATKKLQELMDNPSNKEVLNEYFMWVNVLNTPVNIVDVPEEEVQEEKSKTPKKTK